MKNNILLYVAIIVSAIIIASGLVAVQKIKQKSIEKQQFIELESKEKIETNRLNQEKKIETDELNLRKKIETDKLNLQEQIEAEKAQSKKNIEMMLNDCLVKIKEETRNSALLFDLVTDSCIEKGELSESECNSVLSTLLDELIAEKKEEEENCYQRFPIK